MPIQATTVGCLQPMPPPRISHPCHSSSSSSSSRTRGESNDALQQRAGRACTHVGQLKGRAR
eukprot:2599893-Amphidinium_carterae.1